MEKKKKINESELSSPWAGITSFLGRKVHNSISFGPSKDETNEMRDSLLLVNMGRVHCFYETWGNDIPPKYLLTNQI